MQPPDDYSRAPQYDTFIYQKTYASFKKIGAQKHTLRFLKRSVEKFQKFNQTVLY